MKLYVTRLGMFLLYQTHGPKGPWHLLTQSQEAGHGHFNQIRVRQAPLGSDHEGDEVP